MVLPDFTAMMNSARAEGIHRFTTGVIIVHKNKVLMVERAKTDFLGGLFELPGGEVEQDEFVEQCVVREVKEETSLAVASFLDYVGSFDYLSGSGRRTRQFTVVVSVMPFSKIVLSEHKSFCWASLSDIKCLNVSAETRELLQTFFRTK